MARACSCTTGARCARSLIHFGLKKLNCRKFFLFPHSSKQQLFPPTPDLRRHNRRSLHFISVIMMYSLGLLAMTLLSGEFYISANCNRQSSWACFDCGIIRFAGRCQAAYHTLEQSIKAIISLRLKHFYFFAEILVSTQGCDYWRDLWFLALRRRSGHPRRVCRKSPKQTSVVYRGPCEFWRIANSDIFIWNPAFVLQCRPAKRGVFWCTSFLDTSVVGTQLENYFALLCLFYFICFLLLFCRHSSAANYGPSGTFLNYEVIIDKVIIDKRDRENMSDFEFRFCHRLPRWLGLTQNQKSHATLHTITIVLLINYFGACLHACLESEFC